MEKIKNFLFVNTNIKQTVIKNTFWLFVGELGMRILKLSLFIFAARKLGVSEWGNFSYILAIMSSFAIVSDIGINAVILRETARNNLDTEKYISTSFFLKVGLSLLASFLFLTLLLFFDKNSVINSLIPITAVLLFVDSLREFGFSLNRAFEKMEVEAATKIITTLLLLILSFFFIIQQPKSVSLISAYLISAFVGIVIMFVSLSKHFKKIFSNFKKNLILKIFKEAWPIAIVGILNTIMINIDTIILGWFKDSTQIGLYSAAQKPIQIIYLIPSLISTALFPIFSRLAVSNRDEMKKIVKKYSKYLIYIGLLMTLVCLTIGGYIFIFLFGEQYLESVLIFKIFSVALIAGAPAVIISNALFAIGKQKKLLHYILLTIIINIIFCLSSVPRFGIYGAAFSVTISQLIGNIYLIIKSKKDI